MTVAHIDRVHRPICTQMTRDTKVMLSGIAMCATVIKYNVSMCTCRYWCVVKGRYARMVRGL